jgi:hypothetical protein
MFNISKFLNKGSDWASALRSLKPLLEDQEGAQALESSLKHLDRDLKALQKLQFLASSDIAVGAANQENAESLCGWHNEGHAPSLCAMAIYACEHMGIKSPDMVQALLVAAVLGDVPNELPYHNNLHFKKVMLQTIRLVSTHNEIFHGTPRALSEHESALLLIAASIHDFKHDGKGNTIKGVHQTGRLERRSYDLAKPLLMKAGLNQPADLRILEILLLCTDVSPLDDPSSPMRQMKAAYKHHFLGEKRYQAQLNLSEDLKLLEKDAALCDMALILHEADVATSAGMDYALSQNETASYRAEIGLNDARPQHIIDFLNDVCQRQFLGDAGKKLYGANLARIYALAEQDVQAGDEQFSLETKLHLSMRPDPAVRTIN